MQISYTNDIPRDASSKRTGKWKSIMEDLMQSDFRAVRIENEDWKSAQHVRTAAIRAVKMHGFDDIQVCARGTEVYLIRKSKKEE